jgi:hypothetical protein
MDTPNIIHAEGVSPWFPDLNARLIMAGEGIEIMRFAPENCLRLRFCHISGCRAMFFVCKSCDRGQRYCSPQCRQLGRLQQRREANSRYQRTERGRVAHLRRQRIYRQKRFTPSVTDQGSLYVAQTSSRVHPIPSRCAICQKESHWLDPFDQISPRLWKRVTRGWGGQSSKKYVFT